MNYTLVIHGGLALVSVISFATAHLQKKKRQKLKKKIEESKQNRHHNDLKTSFMHREQFHISG